MRDRLRRKKKADGAGHSASESTQSPLQPTLPDPIPEPAKENQQSSATSEASASPTGGEAQRAGPVSSSRDAGGKKRRRRRGQRGRGRAPQASAPQPPLQPAYPEVEAPSGIATSETGLPEEARAAVAAEHPKRASKGAVVLAIGLPGSGKSTWFKRHAIKPLSSDLVRSMIFDNIEEQRYQDLVFSTLRALLRARMLARMPVNYVDATNLSPHERRGWIKMARDFGYEVQAVFFDVPLEVCTERNRRRERIVAEDVMQRMAAKLRPPTFEEGFSKITVVRVKQPAE